MSERGAMAVLQGWRRKFVSVLEVVLFGLVLSLLALISLQVFTRYVLQAALPWTEEGARMLLVWAVMLGAAVAMERKQHYAITVLSSSFRGGTRTAVLLITNVLGLVFLIALVRYGSDYAAANVKTVYVSTQVSRSWIYLAMPFGAVIMGISLILHSIEVWLNRSESPVSPDMSVTPDV